MAREHSTEGKAAQNLDGRIRKARRREDAPPDAEDWAIHLGRYDIYLWNAWKMVAVEVPDAEYYLSRHPEATVTIHPRTRFMIERPPFSSQPPAITVLRPPVALAQIRLELGVK